jgi:hypothetical protein
VVAAIDREDVGQPAGDVELAVEAAAEITRAQPRFAVRNPLGMAAGRQPG